MNRNIKSLVLALFIASCVILPTKSFAVSNTDQGCPNVTAGLFTYGNRDPGVLFKPQYNTLDGVTLRVKQVFNNGNGADLTVSIYDYNRDDHPNIGSSTKHISRDDEYWEMFEFPDISVVPGGRYTLQVSMNELQHVEIHANSSMDCYERGYSFDKYSSPVNDRMFGFSTYGFNSSSSTPAPSDQPTATAAGDSNSTSNDQSSSSDNSSSQSSSPTGSSRTSSKAPSKPDSSIAKPGNLIAIGQDDGFVRLDWQASTTSNIDGYLKFRSQKENEGFSQIAKTEKKVLNYVDNSPTNNHTNYYFVRAYRGVAESESSNIANVIPEKPTSILWPAIIFGAIILIFLGIIIAGIIIFIIIKKNRSKAATK